MAISKTQLIPELLKECPELQLNWEEYSGWTKERGSDADYFSGAWLYLRIRNLRTEGDTEFFPRFFEFLERLIINGNAEVKTLALDGFLKGLHRANSISIKPGPEAFAIWMRPETKRHWQQFSAARCAADRLKDAEEEDARLRSVLFRLRPAKLWGDYGTVLMRGIAVRDEESGNLLLDRAGPFAPPIFFPRVRASGHQLKSGYCAIVTQSFRELLENADLGQLDFRPAIKRSIIDIPWHTWDRLAMLPAILPKSGEPENFILGCEHSTKAAQEMEDMWELLAPGVPCEFERDQPEVPARSSINQCIISHIADAYRGLFCPNNNPHLWLADEPTRLWFEQYAGEWVRFDYVIRGDDNPKK